MKSMWTWRWNRFLCHGSSKTRSLSVCLPVFLSICRSVRLFLSDLSLQSSLAAYHTLTQTHTDTSGSLSLCRVHCTIHISNPIGKAKFPSFAQWAAVCKVKPINQVVLVPIRGCCVCIYLACTAHISLSALYNKGAIKAFNLVFCEWPTQREWEGDRKAKNKPEISQQYRKKTTTHQC